MTIPVKTDVDMNHNQLLNPVAHKATAAPNSPVAAQFAFFSNTLWFYNGDAWINTGLTLATDIEAAAGVLETKAVNPKQLGLKANINSPAFTGTPTAPTASAGTNNEQVATTEYVDTAINAATLNAKIYMGAWDTTGETDFSGLDSYKPIKKGYFFDVIGSGCTIDGVEYKAGDAITFKSNVAVGTTITSAMIHKTDNTESDDIVRLDSNQTLTNKTIDADNNTIKDLTTGNFKSGEIVSTVTANSGKLITSGGVAAKLADYQTNLTFGTGLSEDNGTVTVDHPFIALAENSLVRGGKGGTLAEITAGTDGQVFTIVSGVPTWQFPVSQIKKRSFTNPSLTPSSGVCTWSISHDLATKDFTARVYDVSTGENVIMDIVATSTTSVSVQFNSASVVAAGTYCLVLIG